MNKKNNLKDTLAAAEGILGLESWWSGDFSILGGICPPTQAARGADLVTDMARVGGPSCWPRPSKRR